MAQTPPPTITAAPTVPQRGIKATFSNLVDAFNTWLAAAVAQFAAVATNVYNNAVDAFGSAGAAAQSATNASQSASAAATSAGYAADSVVAAASAIGAPPWTSGSTYQQFDTVVSRITYKSYRKITTAAANTGGGTDPANDAVNWLVVGAPAIPRSARTSNTSLTLKDIGTIVDIQSGTFTQTFDAASLLGNGWYVWLWNSGAGDITLDPSGAETIDGLSSFIMYRGEARLVQCDGATFRSYVIRPFLKAFTSSATFIKPPGYVSFAVEAWGGGGSGAASAYSSSASTVTGGLGGGYVSTILFSDDVADATSVVIGAGGATVSASGTLLTGGNAGGNTTFGSWVTAYGGAGGLASSSNPPLGPLTGTSGLSKFGALLLEVGGGAYITNLNAPLNGTDTFKSGPGGGSACGPINVQYTSLGGNSTYGGKGGDANNPGSAGVSVPNNATAGSGVAPAGGGGACKVNSGFTANSGAGARGELRIRGII